MTEFETKLIEQLELLNKNLSTQNIPLAHNSIPNFAETLVVSFKAIEKRI